MTPGEVARVLAKAAAFDQRTVGEADIAAWHEALAGIEYGDALAAVTGHYQETESRLMPVHVRRLALAAQRERHRIERVHREAISAAAYPSVATDQRAGEVDDLLQQAKAHFGPGDPNVLRRREWVEFERRRQRAERAAAEPNPHFLGLPPPGGLPLGECYASKSADTIYTLFSVDLTGREPGEAIGDGSRVEAESKAVWLPAAALATIRDPHVSTMFVRLRAREVPDGD